MGYRELLGILISVSYDLTQNYVDQGCVLGFGVPVFTCVCVSELPHFVVSVFANCAFVYVLP